MRRHRDDDRNRGRQGRGRHQDDRRREGGSRYGREAVGRPVTDYAEGPSPGYDAGRGVGAVSEMGERGMAGYGGGGSFGGMGFPMSVGGHGTYVAGHRSTGYGYGPGGEAYRGGPDEGRFEDPHQSRDWAPYRGQPDWPRHQQRGESGGGDSPRGTSQGEQSFRGRGPRGYKRSDDRIREDVCDRLTEDHDVDASDIEVVVQAGEVTLEGTVGERRLKWMAEEIASRCSGVLDVHNHLRVARQQPVERPERESADEAAMPRNGGRPGQQTQTAQSGLGAQNRTDR